MFNCGGINYNSWSRVSWFFFLIIKQPQTLIFNRGNSKEKEENCTLGQWKKKWISVVTNAVTHLTAPLGWRVTSSMNVLFRWLYMTNGANLATYFPREWVDLGGYFHVLFLLIQFFSFCGWRIEKYCISCCGFLVSFFNIRDNKPWVFWILDF